MTSLGWGLSAWTRVVSGSMSSVEVGHNVRGQRCRQGRHCGLSVGREGFDSAPRATSLPFAALRAGFSSGATSRRFAPPSRLRSQAGRSLRREGGTRDVSDEVEVGSADKPAALSVRAAWFARLNSRLPGSHSVGTCACVILLRDGAVAERRIRRGGRSWAWRAGEGRCGAAAMSPPAGLLP
jgi:hypothetical protein